MLSQLNYFVLAVIGLEIVAAAQYVRQGLWLEAGLWLSYAVGNACLVFMAVYRLNGK